MNVHQGEVRGDQDDRGDPADRRRRTRRFGLLLLGGVLLLVALTVGYVQLFGHVLRDPSKPPTISSAANPRVWLFEAALAAVTLLTISIVAWWLRRPRPGKESR